MKKIYFVLLIFLLFLAGCVYYNTLYNAKKVFREAEEQRENQGAAKARVKYNTVIKKCAYIVKEYKDSKYADDALFLLSKALFYKGANYTQAIENFEQLIKFYPKSEFVPEAKIFIARAKYKLNVKGEAYIQLEKILQSDVDDKYKAEAMLLLAKYYSYDEKYEKAENYLKQLISKYKKSDEFAKAMVMLGEIYYKQKKFSESLEIFKKISKQKHFEKRIKLDAVYYMALNHFEMKHTQEAFKIVSKLLLRETRSNVIPKIRILQARILVQKGEYNKAINLFSAVMKDNRRTYYSAEAAYRIGEIYFNYIKNYQKAIEFYNKVKTEKRDSEFKEDAMIKSSIASQIIQYHNPPQDVDPISLINQQMKLAEYYFDILNQPDSTMKIYDGIFAFKDTLQAKLDTLIANIKNMETKIDSTDSLNYVNKKNKLDELKKAKENYTKIMDTYINEVIPKIYFNKVWIYTKIYKDTIKAEETFEILKKKYPKNKYRYAAENFLKGKKVVFHTPQEILYWKEYENAVAMMDSLPDNAKRILLQIKDTTDEELKKKVNFALGYISYFALKDTSNAKIYFDGLLKDNIYGSFIKKFYNGERFVIIDSLNIPSTLITEDSDEKKEKNKIKDVDKKAKDGKK